jgi:hypothetical protein
MHRSIRMVAVLVVLGLVLVACGDDDAAPATTASATTTAAATTAAASVEPVEVIALDYAFVGLPEKVKPGTTFVLKNESSQEVHELVAVRLPDDETRPVVELLQLPQEELEALFPLVETVIVAPPDQTGFPVEGTGTLTEPGRYAIICAIPTGADPDEFMAAAAESEGGPPEVAGGPPHFVNGMFGEVIVEA